MDQSNNGLMGSSAKTGKKFFEGHRSTFWIKMTFGIGHPPTYTSIAVYMCGRGFKGPKSLNGIRLSQFRSKVLAFLVILLSPWSPRCPHRPHIISVILTSSLCHPCCPHIVPIAPEGPHVIPMAVVSVVSIVSVVSTPCCPRGLHVIPVIPTSSPFHAHHPHIV